ncbi:MAG: hypothetical protein HKN91_10585 [Acidimicrobiia bacterium]|nr:hypothetical protein [Acidimicrobiia bacterium]
MDYGRPSYNVVVLGAVMLSPTVCGSNTSPSTFLESCGEASHCEWPQSHCALVSPVPQDAEQLAAPPTVSQVQGAYVHCMGDSSVVVVVSYPIVRQLKLAAAAAFDFRLLAKRL